MQSTVLQKRRTYCPERDNKIRIETREKKRKILVVRGQLYYSFLTTRQVLVVRGQLYYIRVYIRVT